MIKIGFVFNFDKSSWLGGYNYYKNLFYFIDKYKKNIKPIIITANKKLIKKDLFFSKYKIYETNLVDGKNVFLRFFQKICLILLGQNFLFLNFLKKNNIDLLSHNFSLGYFSKIPSFPWFPDFQEIHLPENFSLKDKILRRLNVYIASLHATKIILSSKSAQKDLKKINSKAYKKSIVLKHEDILSTKIICISKNKTKKKFNIKKDYFIICDQFWKHKNHIVILKALKYLKNNNKNFLVISTGLMHDRRHPNYIMDLKKYISENKLEENFKTLGIVDEVDLMSLIKHSICLLKPSKSEGLSNSVEQAKNLGTKVIMSNISVHKEQKEKNCLLFQPDNHVKLSKLMMKVKKIKKKIKNNKTEIKSDFMKKYLKTIKESIASHN